MKIIKNMVGLKVMMGLPFFHLVINLVLFFSSTKDEVSHFLKNIGQTMIFII